MNKHRILLRTLLFSAPILILSAFTGQKIAAAPATAAAATFKSKCAVCHGPDGAGATALGKQLKVNDLRAPVVQKKTDAQLTDVITKGQAPMPAFGQTLSSEEIKGLVSYIRGISKS